MRNCLAELLREAGEEGVATEQVVPHWSTADEAAVLDVVRVGRDGAVEYFDVTVAGALPDRGVERAAAVRDGARACELARRKHRRYPGPGLTAVAWEAGGRPGEETEAWVRGLFRHLPSAEQAGRAAAAWQRLSVTLQRGNAAMLTAAGARVL